MVYPCLTNSFLNYFVNDNLKDKTLLEIGSGDSTLFWESHFQKITSYEDDLYYYNNIKDKINREKTSLIFYDKNIFNNELFLEDVRKADYIIIDNNPNVTFSRLQFAEFVVNNKNDDSSIILDNGTWNLDAYNYLIKNFFCKDFPGYNKNNDLTVTTIFDVRRDISYFIC